jgi:hypothetical protein
MKSPAKRRKKLWRWEMAEEEERERIASQQ